MRLRENLGFLYKYRGARDAASVDIRHPVRSAGSLFGSKWFAIGMVVATGAWGFHVLALALAPMSVVQVVLSGGVVLLAVIQPRRVVGVHVLRNSLIPVVTSLGIDIGELMGGAIITEGVFNVPGVGFNLFRASVPRTGPGWLASSAFWSSSTCWSASSSTCSTPYST